MSLTVRALNRALLERQLLLRRQTIGIARGDRAPGRHAGPGAAGALHRALEPPPGLRPRRALAHDRGQGGRARDVDATDRAPRHRRRLPRAPAGDAGHGRARLREQPVRTADPGRRSRRAAGGRPHARGGTATDDRRPAQGRSGRAGRTPTPRSLAYAVRYHLPLVPAAAARAVADPQGRRACPPSPRSSTGSAARSPARRAQDDDHPPLPRRVRPGDGADIAAWSGLTKVREAVEPLDDLRTLRDRRRPGAARHPGRPVPRHRDTRPAALPPAVRQRRARPQGPHAHRHRPRPPDPRARQADGLLIDGFLRGTWKLDDDPITVDVWDPLTDEEQRQVDEEAEQLSDVLARPSRASSRTSRTNSALVSESNASRLPPISTSVGAERLAERAREHVAEREQRERAHPVVRAHARQQRAAGRAAASAVSHQIPNSASPMPAGRSTASTATPSGARARTTHDRHGPGSVEQHARPHRVPRPPAEADHRAGDRARARSPRPAP